MTTDYRAFLEHKCGRTSSVGFAPTILPTCLFDFQSHLVDFAIQRGRAAIFADCGLGKTLMELAWSANVIAHTNRPVLLLTPLAVGRQILKEADRFGFEATRARTGWHGGSATTVIANYEQLHRFTPDDFAGVVCDESSILKSFDGATKQRVTEFMRAVNYRLLATATAAPNDYIELGTSSEALGELGYMDVLGRFFVNDQHSAHPFRRQTETARWRFKGHGEQPFWRWVASWARSMRKPSDLGFADDRFLLPPLEEQVHIVEAKTLLPGMLFARPAQDLREEREERRRTLIERCEHVAQLTAHSSQAIIWCHLNTEGDRLEQIIPGAIQVAGADSDERKEEVYQAFADGEVRVLITKPKIGAWGMNWQQCAHVVTFVTHSYEQYYQSVRRCWRFGQTRPVHVDVIASEGEVRVFENLKRKTQNAERMFNELTAAMSSAMRLERIKDHPHIMELPRWVF